MSSLPPPYCPSTLTNEELEKNCKHAETLVVDEAVYKAIPQADYIRNQPIDKFWEFNYEDQGKSNGWL